MIAEFNKLNRIEWIGEFLM